MSECNGCLKGRFCFGTSHSNFFVFGTSLGDANTGCICSCAGTTEVASNNRVSNCSCNKKSSQSVRNNNSTCGCSK